jgi:enoyl-CoA hydratase/carnithine racemase
VPPADVDAVAIELAAQCAAQAPIAVRYAKEAVLSGLDLPLAHAMRMELDLAILLQSTDDRWEGLAAFHERRRPTMRGT